MTTDIDSADAVVIDRDAIRNLIADFARRIDTKDQDGYAANFTARVLVLPFGAITGRAAIAASPGPRNTFATAHLLGNPVITLDGDRAEVRTPVQATHVLTEGAQPGWAGAGTSRTSSARRRAGVSPASSSSWPGPPASR